MVLWMNIVSCALIVTEQITEVGCKYRTSLKQKQGNKFNTFKQTLTEPGTFKILED